MTTVHRISPFMLPLFLVACGVSTGGEPGSVSSPASEPSASVVPTLVDGNPTCASLGLAGYELKFDFGTKGTFSGDLGSGETVTWTYDGKTITWSSTIGMDAVIVKGSDAANVYSYNPESLGDSGLVTPINSSGGNAGLSHIDFCYDWEVKVQKTAVTSYTRSYSWGIDKTSSVQELLLALGQTYLASYNVAVSVSGHTDSDWAVAGTITVKNPDPKNSATVTSVTDQFNGGALAVDCGSATFPVTLAPGATLTCTYASSLTGAIDGTNVATATTTGAVGSGVGSAAVTFGAPTNAVDDCVTVHDDKYGNLGTVCQDAAPKTFTYSLAIGPYAVCGTYGYDNTASFVANDSGATGQDTWSISSEVPCQNGCSLTPGYWKTHSSYGPAPYDDAWALLLPAGPNSPFFQSGQTYYQVLWTAPLGNAYYILAHAYIAAVLNGLNGADTSAITSALSTAQSLLAGTTPAAMAGVKGAKKTVWISLAGILDSYNNGLIGPGHCSE